MDRPRLAQFLYSNPYISLDEFMEMEVILAWDFTQQCGRGRSPIQFYLLYSAHIDKFAPSYYFFVDRKMRQSKALFKTDAKGLNSIAPIEVLPPHLLDSDTNNKAGQPDALQYFGHLEAGEFNLSHFRTDNGYEISLRKRPRHDPDGIGDMLLFDIDRDDIRIFNGQLRNYSSVYGTLIARDIWAPESRVLYVQNQRAALSGRKNDVRFKAALEKILARIETYGNKQLAADPSAAQRAAVLSQFVKVKTSIESQSAIKRCQDIF